MLSLKGLLCYRNQTLKSNRIIEQKIIEKIYRRIIRQKFHDVHHSPRKDDYYQRSLQDGLINFCMSTEVPNVFALSNVGSVSMLGISLDGNIPSNDTESNLLASPS